MRSYKWHDAQTDSIQMKDITSEYNQEFLRRLKDNDPDFTELSVCDGENASEGYEEYIPDSAHDLGWLGFFIGKNTHLQELVLTSNLHDNLHQLCKGLRRNRSIQKIWFGHLSGGEFLQMLCPFFKNNHNLMEIEFSHCNLGAEGCRLLSLAIGGCSKSLTRFTLSFHDEDETQLVDIIVALSMHPQLQELQLFGTNIGRNESIALATLLRWTTIELQTLDLMNNDIGDADVEGLVGALANGNKLRELNLSGNRSITTRGWRAVSTLLATPNSNLEELLLGTMITDEGMIIFASALASNCKLRILDLDFDDDNIITAEGWAALSKLLCDASSVNNTFLSNHTLQDVGDAMVTVTHDVRSSLDLNRGADKKQVAIIKLLQNHRHFDMQPLFEWDFKALPLVIDWFKRAAACHTDFNPNIGSRKLSSIYQFIRGMPMLYIESRLNQELSEVHTTEMKLEQEQLELTLKLQDI